MWLILCVELMVNVFGVSDAAFPEVPTCNHVYTATSRAAQEHRGAVGLGAEGKPHPVRVWVQGGGAQC